MRFNITTWVIYHLDKWRKQTTSIVSWAVCVFWLDCVRSFHPKPTSVESVEIWNKLCKKQKLNDYDWQHIMGKIAVDCSTLTSVDIIKIGLVHLCRCYIFPPMHRHSCTNSLQFTSSWSVHHVGNAVRFIFRAEELSRGVATSAEASMMSDWIRTSISDSPFPEISQCSTASAMQALSSSMLPSASKVSSFFGLRSMLYSYFFFFILNLIHLHICVYIFQFIGVW